MTVHQYGCVSFKTVALMNAQELDEAKRSVSV
jgi:hypothetical protein